jgi:hypothetical protein
MVRNGQIIGRELIRYYPGICLKELGKTTKNISAEIRTDHLPNIRQERHHYTNLLGRQSYSDLITMSR